MDRSAPRSVTEGVTRWNSLILMTPNEIRPAHAPILPPDRGARPTPLAGPVQEADLHDLMKARGAPESKDSSYRAANAWWLARKAEIDAAEASDFHLHDHTLDTLKIRLAWAQRHGDGDRASAVAADIEMLEG